MKKSFNNYQRIAKSRMSSVWVGDDHVVYVQGSGFLLPFTERYSRFRLCDIQCLAITETNRVGWIVLHLFSALVFLGVVAAIFSVNRIDNLGVVELVSICFFGLVGLLFVALLVRTLVLGPTCKTNLKTTIKSEHLKPLNRVRKANEVTEKLAGFILEAQRDIG